MNKDAKNTVYKPLCGHVWTFLLDKYTNVKSLDQIIDIYLNLKKLPECFQVGVPSYTAIPSKYSAPRSRNTGLASSTGKILPTPSAIY